MSSKMFEASDIVEIAVRIEENGSNFYKYAEQIAKQEEAKNLFSQLAAEEIAHKKIFESLFAQIEKYNPPEKYEGEYDAYLRDYVDNNIIFTKEAMDKELSQVKDTAAALDFAIKREMDSILYYHEIKRFVPVAQHLIIDQIIDEERKHFSRLSEAKKDIAPEESSDYGHDGTEKEGDVFVLSLINGARANTITDDVIAEYNAVLDELEAAPGNAALVVTSSDPKYWSNGIDREWLMTMPPGYLTQLASSLDRLYLRMVLLNMPTVGCLTGHAYAAAAILAATFDFRLMRADRGFFCFPEVDIHIPFTPVIHQIVNSIADRPVINELVLTGKRIGGEEALKMKVVSAIYPEDALLPKTMEFAEFLARKDRAMYTKLKRNMRIDLVRLQQNLPDMQ